MSWRVGSTRGGDRPCRRLGHRVWRISGVAWLSFGAQSSPAQSIPWEGDTQFRVELKITPKRAPVTGAPVAVEMDFQRWIRDSGREGQFDPESVTVTAVTAEANDGNVRGAGMRSRLAHRVDRLFGGGIPMLHFVMPDDMSDRFLVYFDTVESATGQPERYDGLVGDGDFVVERFQRRDINASHFDAFVDLDVDGDLDLFKGGVEPYVYVYENVGGQRFIDRGRLASEGKLLAMPHSESNRSWVTVAFHDLDGDEDQDLVASCNDGPARGLILAYIHGTNPTTGEWVFESIGPLRTRSGAALGGDAQSGGWFPSICFVAGWDQPGKDRIDALVGSGHRCWFYRGLEHEAGGAIRFEEPAALKAGGREIELVNPRFEVVDLDGDGDLDLLAGTQPGPIHWFANIGTRERPVLTNGVVVAYGGRYLIGDAHSGVRAADWDGDGLVDLVAGRFWERADLGMPMASRFYGGLFKNVGERGRPRFESRDVWHGSPFTERFQKCDAVRQNSVRARDWDGDGRLDLLAGDTDGFIWYFHNDGNAEGGHLGPVFATGQPLRAGVRILSLAASGGHARLDVCDWNGDQRSDLIVADGQGTVTLFLNEARSGLPQLAMGRPVLTKDGVLLRVGGRASVLVCDWNQDDRVDVLLADEKGYYVCRNEGDPGAVPVLAPPSPIFFGGEPVRYVRPNLGSFVDWDGDGKKDLIGCHFENSILFYRNVGSGARGEDPVFEHPDGVTLLEGESPQMISGADAVDWNGDRDLDILTGQGHGGSGLRFYARDWLENERRGTHPDVVVTGPVEWKP